MSEAQEVLDDEASPEDQWWVAEEEAPDPTIPAHANPIDRLEPVMNRSVRSSYTSLKLMKGNGTAYRMNDRAKDRAVRAFARSGLIYIAAAAAGCSAETIRQHRRTDEVFEEAMQEAYAEYCAALEMSAHERAFVGVLEPVVGRVGKDEDGVITHVRRYSDRLTEMMLKRHMPGEFVERMQVEQQISGGVLVIGAPMSEAEWVASYGGQQVQPTLPILEQFRAELGMAPSNQRPDAEGMVNITPKKDEKS